MNYQNIIDSMQNSEPLRDNVPSTSNQRATTLNLSDGQNAIAKYIERFITIRFPRGLTADQMMSFQKHIWAELYSNWITLKGEAEIDALLEAQAIGQDMRCRLGKAWVPEEYLWMLYDPCMTTRWADDDVATRFQAFLRKRQAEEQKEARRKRHASADRRKNIIEQHQQGIIGGLISEVANHFVAGLLKELHVAHQISKQLEKDEDDWKVVGSSGARPLSLSGLFAKWCPTPGGMHDKALGIAPIIRNKLVERLRGETNSSLKEAILCRSDLVELDYLSLQRDVLTPLRRQAEVPEHFIGASKGVGVNYYRMASRCRLLFGSKVFRRLDQENYDYFLLDAAKSAQLKQLEEHQDKAFKVNAGALAPHEVMMNAVKAEASGSSVAKVEAELQWQALLDSCSQSTVESSKTGTKTKRLIIPMCDVSGSMCCPCADGQATCMDVACSLSLLLTDSLPKSNPYSGKILTFSNEPVFVELKERSAALTVECVKEASSLEEIAGLMGNLAERVKTLKQSDWGGSTDFFKAMVRICDVASEYQLKADDIGCLELVVFSDMEFNQAQYGNKYDQKTMLEKIRQLFFHRFGPTVHPPKIVFWNLRASSSGSGVAKDANEEGVALLSGLSAGVLQKYLNWSLASSTSESKSGDEKVNPTRAMLACLENPLYETLRLEKDLMEWEVLVSEEEIMKRAQKVSGENSELVYTSNSSALVALFFEVVPGIGVDRLDELLSAAFEENPLVALKLVFNLGSVRKGAAGKADRFNFQAALLWLFRTWPKTYCLNTKCIAQFSSLKEMLNSVMFILYEHEMERDPDNHALYSLAGQKKALEEHKQRQKFRNNQARRHRKKLERLQLWSEFSRSEKRMLFGDLRVDVDWEVFNKRLCIEGVKRECHRPHRVSKQVGRNTNFMYEDSWGRRERLASEWEARNWKKRDARLRKQSRVRLQRRKQHNRCTKGDKRTKRKAQTARQMMVTADEDTW